MSIDPSTEARERSRRAHSVRAYSRRDLLRSTSAGFGSVALGALSSAWNGVAADQPDPVRPESGPMTVRKTHHPARAKRIVFLFMQGGPSGIDTFDPKPRLEKEHGQSSPLEKPEGLIDPDGKLFRSPWTFRQYGQSGIPVSELFPEVARHVDDLCVIRSMHTEGQAHGQAVLKLHTGDAAFVRPSMGSWIQYGLGSENENLPGFITITPLLDLGGVQLYGNAFLPAVYQGTALGNATTPIAKATFPHLKPPVGPEGDLQRREVDFVQRLNRDYRDRDPQDSSLDGVIQSYELAFRMQRHAPQLLDLSNESRATLDAYGVGVAPTEEYGRGCLLARRFLEAGVRFVQVTHPGKWDHHAALKTGHEKSSREVDRPIAAFLADLKARGLLDDTLVLWGGEFGRTPTQQGADGRDHNPQGFTVWVAGGGVKAGHIHGSTDEYGYYAAENKVHMHDLHATLLHLLGLDHMRLTYRFAGRDFRLTDVHGRIVHEIIA